MYCEYIAPRTSGRAVKGASLFDGVRGQYLRIPKDTVVCFGTQSYNLVYVRIVWYEFVYFGICNCTNSVLAYCLYESVLLLT